MGPIATTREESAELPLVWTLEQLLEQLPRGRSTLYRWIAEESFPVVRVDERSDPLFPPASVRAWLQEREVRSESRTQSTRALEAAQAQVRRSQRRRASPQPIAAAGSAERLRRIHGSH